MVQPLNNDDTYDIVYFVIAPSHPQSQEYLFKMWKICKALEHQITNELSVYIGGLNAILKRES